MIRLFGAIIAIVAFAGPALAEFFIVRDNRTAPCRVVATRPTDTKIVVVGNKNGYKDQAEAISQVAVLCK